MGTAFSHRGRAAELDSAKAPTKAPLSRRSARTLPGGGLAVEDGQTVLVFCPERRSVEPFADVIVNLHERGPPRSLLEADPAVLSAAIALAEEWRGRIAQSPPRKHYAEWKNEF
ncbi:hypothetical protein [Bradyrhizobium sp. USDA 3458]|uniref:hypothetical protein n=1 Tax=Bradyrhizobium sp. USDA 3458 TaxID=2591461 RepID=UPI001FEF6040|nr:hypothetical protein [Bradyrhizobium sp. USDA 3458]